jgi:hypothetical protein
MPKCRIKVGGSSDELPAVEAGARRKFRLSGVHRGICPVSVEVKGKGDVAARFEFVKRYGRQDP